MRPLRGALPLAVLLMLAAVLPGSQPQDAAPTPYAVVLRAAPTLACAVPERDPCTADDATWSLVVPVADGLTALRVEAVADAPAALAGLLAAVPVPFALHGDVTPPDGASVPFTFGATSPARVERSWAAPLGAGSFVLDLAVASDAWGGVLELPGAHNALWAQGALVVVTFAHWGYELAPGGDASASASPVPSLAVPDAAPSQSQTLLGEAGVNNPTLPCASTWWTTAANGPTASGAC